LVTVTGVGGTTFGTIMTDVLAMEPEGPAVFTQKFRVLLGDPVEAGVTYELGLAVTAAVGINLSEDLIGQRGTGK
jgi:hypothetical protein